MDENSDSTQHDIASASSAAESAAASASGAAAAAGGAQLEAIHAADAAESAAASAAHVEAAVTEVGQNVAAAAEQVTEAAVAAAVEQIEHDLEEENTWLENELTEVKGRIEQMMQNLSALPTAAQLSELMSRMENLQSQLSNLIQSNQPHRQGGGQDGHESPTTAQTPSTEPAPPAKKRRVKI